ncbi:hypothetical protein HOD61_02020 [archaeon]|jgi:hypothetical protein|nr:hypothetical protein [archaeon]
MIDPTSLMNFLPVFVFILIVTLLYATLEKTKLLGENSGLNFSISLVIAFISLFSGSAIKLMVFVVPWYVFMMFFLLLLFSMFMFFGFDEKEVWPMVGGRLTIFVVMMLFLIIGITKVFGPVFNPYSVEGTSDVLRTIFHPRVLGAFFILLISFFLIKNISDNV